MQPKTHPSNTTNSSPIPPYIAIITQRHSAIAVRFSISSWRAWQTSRFPSRFFVRSRSIARPPRCAQTRAPALPLLKQAPSHDAPMSSRRSPPEAPGLQEPAQPTVSASDAHGALVQRIKRQNHRRRTPRPTIRSRIDAFGLLLYGTSRRRGTSFYRLRYRRRRTTCRSLAMARSVGGLTSRGPESRI